jgi:hypothetical protein
MSKYSYLLIFIVLFIVFFLTIYGVSPGSEFFSNFGPGSASNNLITNGNFEGGKDIGEKIKSEGDNQIIILPNPGKSSYVLKQSFVPQSMNYYLLRIAVESNESYQLSFWYYCENGSDLEQTLLKLEIKDKNHQNVVIKGNTQITHKATINNKTWNHVQFLFKVPANILNQYLYIYLGYNMTGGNRYYTDIILKKFLVDAPQFQITDNLQVFLMGSTLNPNDNIHSSIWKDISEKGHDFVWEGKPKYDPAGFYRTYGNSLQGPSGRDLFPENVFTIGINVSIDEELQRISKPNQNGLENLVDNYREILRVPGNNQFGLRIWLPLYYGKMILDISDQRYESDREVMTNNNNQYYFVYDGTTFLVYLNNSLLTRLIPSTKIHFNTQPIILNENRNLNGKLYNIIMYSRALSAGEINRIVSYFQKGLNGTLQLSQLIQPKLELQTLETPSVPLLDPLIVPSTPILLPLGTPSLPLTIPPTPLTKPMLPLCPQVEFRNLEYWVFVPPGSQLEKLVGYCGYKSYGKHQGNALKMFKLNFPECQVPDILILPVRHPNFNKCPYLIRDGNPCFTEECGGVDWNVKDPNQANLSEKCKRNINYYCEKNSQYDPSCYCWQDANKNKPECVEYRRKFMNPEGNSDCQVNYFDIEEHPDISNYVRKDRVPCWGCNLGDSKITNTGPDTIKRTTGPSTAPLPLSNSNSNQNGLNKLSTPSTSIMQPLSPLTQSPASLTSTIRNLFKPSTPLQTPMLSLNTPSKSIFQPSTSLQ